MKIGAFVLIFQVVSVFPNVGTEERRAFATGDGFAHKRIVLVRRGNDFQFATVRHEPDPAAAEATETSGFKLSFEFIKAAEGRRDVRREFARGRATGVRRKAVPEERMIPMTTAVVANGAAHSIGHNAQIFDELFERFGFQRGVAGDGFVQISDVSRVMFVMMDFHRERVEVGFQRGFVVG